MSRKFILKKTFFFVYFLTIFLIHSTDTISQDMELRVGEEDKKIYGRLLESIPMDEGDKNTHNSHERMSDCEDCNLRVFLINNVINNPSIHNDDKAAIIYVAILDKIDQDISRQTQHISWLQNQLPSYNRNVEINIAKLMLRRMLDKRAQINYMLGVIGVRYNLTADDVASIGQQYMLNIQNQMMHD